MPVFNRFQTVIQKCSLTKQDLVKSHYMTEKLSMCMNELKVNKTSKENKQTKTASLHCAEKSKHCCIVKILNLYNILLCTHLYHFFLVQGTMVLGVSRRLLTQRSRDQSCRHQLFLSGRPWHARKEDRDKMKTKNEGTPVNNHLTRDLLVQAQLEEREHLH